ncbi:Rieske (2Fe-2S) protein [Kitasatospora gansuensis]
MTDTTPAPSRRTLLCCGAALAAAAAVAVTGCGSSTSSDSGSGGAAAAPVTVGAVADVPVGGGKVYREAKIVVTQPTGEYKAFSAKCTHAGCVVDEVKDGTVNCPCHYSKFAVADGSVKDGPAPSPLPAYRVTVKDGAFEVTK